MMKSVSCLLATLVPGMMMMFKCPDDGHWPNPESCASYFHCANGRPYEGNCPAGLLWNGIKQECDFPENVNCDVSIGEAAKFKVQEGSYVYMTFDDGPNEGTPYVLDALKEVGLRATFFINSDNLHGDDPEVVAKNKVKVLST